MFSFFKKSPVIAQDNAVWIRECFAWALKNFDQQMFFQHTQLILTTNDFFPGRLASVHGMARAIFDNVVEYTGLSHWPFRLQEPEEFQQKTVPLLNLDCNQRQVRSENKVKLDPEHYLNISYNPPQINKPEDMAAGFAHIVAQHLVVQSQQLPPGGKEYFAEATEIVGIFMGFGVMFANSSYSFKGGCGSCNNPAANRQAVLTESDVVYALALFCLLKKIPNKLVAKQLKNYLRPVYIRAAKEIKAEPGGLAAMAHSD